MPGMLALLQHWLGGAEALAGRAPGLAARLAAGSWPAIALAAALALVLLVAGDRFGRVLAAVGALAVGHAAGLALAPVVGGPIPPSAWAWAVGLTLAVAAGIGPGVYPVALGGLAGALLGSGVPVAGHAALGAAAFGAALATLAFLLRRLVLAATAASAGAVLFAVTLLAVAQRWSALGVLRARPVLLVGIAALLAVAGTAFQLGARADRSARATRPDAERARRPSES